MLHHAWWLLAGVVVMYVYDAVQLLYHNEVVFHEGRDGRWSFSVGSEFALSGRHVFLPPMLAPTRGLLRLRWSSLKAPTQAAPMRGLRAWRIGVSACAWPVLLVACLFAAMPAAVYSPIPVTLAWMAALYLAIFSAIMRLWRVRRVTGLSRKEAAGISSDALLCAPYALNIIRKQGARAGDRFDLVAVAHALLDAPERERLVRAIQARVRYQMDLEDLESERHAQLQAYSLQIEGALA
ncbi:hypothetical protein L2Y96_07800 [Luteibacter aegosomaticola]|uniref:hypothetical protein n=1 Tax=Luteibacter aegosomaticola TaxID=2911538 RepID=UPI001FF79A33|nr:hypothetical protein [Luteibacter aegosomaticola]UPG91658.1 hypothetical protein L2Y96_07800 [Luteibacter aegosomaticola]